MNFSLYRQLECPLTFRSFSVKFVGAGCERYTVNGTNYHVNEGSYLLVNHHAEGGVLIDSKRDVRGICIDVSPALLSEAVGSYLRADTLHPDESLDVFFSSPDFLENTYTAQHTATGELLLAADARLRENPFAPHTFDSDFYFALAAALVADHIPLYRGLQSVRTARYNTRKDLMRRLLRGKEYIERHFAFAPDVATIARECGMSEYHFFRLFKQAFGITPHKHLMQTRIAYCRNRLRTSNIPASDIAIEAGFADVHAFSKSFKEHTGISPVQYRATTR